MKLVITGTTGRVGRALANHLAAEHEIIEMPRAVLDLSAPEAAVRILEGLEFDVLLNPAGLTSLEACEDSPQLARRVNGQAPAALAMHCRENQRRLIHFSTDYVFDGREPGFRSEDDPACPLSIYGLTKRQGEQAVLAAGGTVLRVSWVYGPEKAAFPDSILADALAGRPLAAVADKYSLPTLTTDLAGWVAALLHQPRTTGLLHACNRGEPASWHGMAGEIISFLARAGRIPADTPVQPLELAAMASMRAPRPRHTAMDTRRLAAVPGVTIRDWREAMQDYLSTRLADPGQVRA